MSSRKILVIDDETDMVTLMTNRLQMMGFETVAAYDGIEGIEKVRTERPDLIILDINMPRLGGFALTQLLKRDEKFKAIPIIVVTARAQAKDEQLSYEVGADAYITKPFEADELIEVINNLLKKTSAS